MEGGLSSVQFSEDTLEMMLGQNEIGMGSQKHKVRKLSSIPLGYQPTYRNGLFNCFVEECKLDNHAPSMDMAVNSTPCGKDIGVETEPCFILPYENMTKKKI